MKPMKTNKKLPNLSVGQKVTYYPIRWAEGDFGGEPIETEVTHEPYLSSAGYPVVFVKDVSGYVSCEHVVPRAEN